MLATQNKLQPLIHFLIFLRNRRNCGRRVGSYTNCSAFNPLPPSNLVMAFFSLSFICQTDFNKINNCAKKFINTQIICETLSIYQYSLKRGSPLHSSRERGYNIYHQFYVWSMFCLCLVYVLSMSCLCLVSVLSKSCLCLVYVLSVSCLFLVYVLSMSCLCLVYVLSMSCLCLVYVLSMSYV